MFDVSIELLGYSHNIDQSNDLPCDQRELDQIASDEASRLIASAASRKNKRLSFLNSTDRIKLRMSVYGHLPQRAHSRYCTLCGQNARGKGWRGHRSNISCSLCSVHLCLSVHPGLRKSCWELWHSHRMLKMRQTCPPVKNTSNDRSSGEGEASDTASDEITDEIPRSSQDETHRPSSRISSRT